MNIIDTSLIGNVIYVGHQWTVQADTHKHIHIGRGLKSEERKHHDNHEHMIISDIKNSRRSSSGNNSIAIKKKIWTCKSLAATDEISNHCFPISPDDWKTQPAAHVPIKRQTTHKLNNHLLFSYNTIFAWTFLLLAGQFDT